MKWCLYLLSFYLFLSPLAISSIPTKQSENATCQIKVVDAKEGNVVVVDKKNRRKILMSMPSILGEGLWEITVQMPKGRNLTYIYSDWQKIEIECGQIKGIDTPKLIR